jgi:predicted HTH transcriptional regulator
MARRIEELLVQREGSAVDFKRDSSSMKGIVKDFIAFSNSAGGAILIGVDDERNVIGLDNPQLTEEAISNAIYGSTDPKQVPRISVLTQDDKEVVLVDAQYFQGAEPLRLKEGNKLTVFERVGSNSMPVTDNERLEQIRRERRGRDGFDQLAAVGATLEDLDLEAITEAFAIRNVVIDESKFESYELARRENNRLVPTNAGVLLFGKNPNDFLPDAYFRGIRYPGPNKGGDALDSAEWKGMSLLRGADEVERFIARNTGTAQTIPGRTRREIAHYEPGLLREILHNAIAHADYSRHGQHLNVSIFSDHLLVDSPGKLPAGMSFEYLEAGVSVARNRAIMGILHAIGYVEKHGTVYAKALAAAEQDYPLPVWEEPGPVVRVVLRPHPRALNVEEPPKRQRRDRTTEIVEYLEGHGETTVAELSEAIGISTRQVRNYIQRLEKASRVEPTAHGPRDPRRAYRLAR